MRCAHNFPAETQGADWLNSVPSKIAEFSVRSAKPLVIRSPMCNGVFWKLDILSGSKSLPSFLIRWSVKKITLQMAKKLVKMIRCRYVCYHICWRNYSFSLRQNVSNLCQSIFVFLTVDSAINFSHWPRILRESSIQFDTVSSFGIYVRIIASYGPQISDQFL